MFIPTDWVADLIGAREENARMAIAECRSYRPPMLLSAAHNFPGPTSLKCLGLKVTIANAYYMLFA
jgi:hypothetical protein